MTEKKLIPDIDYYFNSNGDLVFTEKYHLDRGHCCSSGCLHCPYGYGNNRVDPSVPAEFRDAWDAEVLSDDESFDDNEEE